MTSDLPLEEKLRLTADLARHHPQNSFTQVDLWAKEWNPLVHPEHSFELLSAISEYGVEISMGSMGVNISIFSPVAHNDWVESDDCGQNLRNAIFGAAVVIAVANQEGG